MNDSETTASTFGEQIAKYATRHMIDASIEAVAVSRAVNLLVQAGMVVRSANSDSSTYYLSWPGDVVCCGVQPRKRS